jgi:hypothetical protein
MKRIDAILRRLGSIKGSPYVGSYCFHGALGCYAVRETAWHTGMNLAACGVALVIVAVVAGLIEGWFDPHYETPTAAGNGWMDWGTYLIGAVAGLGAVVLGI